MNHILSLRTQLGLSQRQLADVLGTSRSFLSLAELGQRTLTPSAFLRLTDMVASQYRQSSTEPSELEMDPEVLGRLEAQRAAFEAEQNHKRSNTLSLRNKLERQLAGKTARFAQATTAIRQLRSEMAMLDGLSIPAGALSERLSRSMQLWEQNHPVHCEPLVQRIAELNILIESWNNTPQP